MKSDLEIAQEKKLEKIVNIAEKYGISEDDLELYGQYKAKLSPSVFEKRKDKKDGKLVLVTAINPTPMGEGKTTTSVGLVDALAAIGKEYCSSPQRAEPWTMLRSKGRCSRRRICSGRSHGRFESSFYR